MAWSWTQPCCNGCWGLNYPDQSPVRTRSEVTDRETCVHCGKETFSGIYIRVDPVTAKYPSMEK